MELGLGFLYLLILRVCTVKTTLSSHEIQKIREKIFDGYDANIMPLEEGRPINVSVDFFINDMVPLHAASMHFSIDCFFTLQWRDYRLQWDPPNNETYVLPFDHRIAKDLWMPNVYFPELKHGYNHKVPMPNELIYLYPDGNVVYNQRILMDSFCPMNLTYYPFDMQHCRLTVEPYSYNMKFVVLFWRDGKAIDTSEKGNLYVIDFKDVDMSLNSKIVDWGIYGNYSRLSIHLDMTRHSQLSLLRDFIPCILIVFLSWVGFWINYKSTPARVALGITTVLTIVTLTNSVRLNSPHSDSFRSIDVYTLGCNIFVFAAIVEYALVGMSSPKLHHNSEVPSQINETKMRRKLLRKRRRNKKKSNNNNDSDDECVPLSSIPGFQEEKRESGCTFPSRRRKKDSTSISLETVKEDSSPKTNGLTHAERKKSSVRQLGPVVIVTDDIHAVDKYSRSIFPGVFMILNIIFFVFHVLTPDTVLST